MPRHSALQGILHVPRRGVLHKQSCADEFALNMGVLMAAIWHLTEMVVVGVDAIDITN